MRFVEGDDAVEIGPCPVDKLLETAAVLALRAQCRVGDEQHALVERDRLIDFPARKRLDIARQAADCGPVAPGIFEQRFVFRNPDRTTMAFEPAVEDASGDLTPLACPSAVAQEIAFAVATSSFVRFEADAFLIGDEPSRQLACPRVASIDRGFELSGREEACADAALGQVRDIGRDRCGDRAHCHRFDERGRMIAGVPECDAARAIGQIDAELVAGGRGQLQRVVGDRQDIVFGKGAEGLRKRRGCGLHRAQQAEAACPDGGRNACFGFGKRGAFVDCHRFEQIGYAIAA